MALKTCLRRSMDCAVVALLAMASLHGEGARADGTGALDPSFFVFSGFGTFGVVHSSERRADYNANAFSTDGAGFSARWSMEVDSLFAAQVIANPTPQLSVVLQVIAQQNYDNSYRPHVEWANVRYQFTPDFSVRAGRTVLPSFLLSDARKVGYAYPWVRPPLEVYRLLPVNSSDGVDVSYHKQVGAVANTFQANVGRNTIKLANNSGSVDVRDSWGLVYSADHGPWSARLSYRAAELTIAELNPLFDAFRQFGPEGEAIADKHGADDRAFSLTGIGASYDPGDWFVMAEWGQLDSKAFVGKQRGWYASGGYRFGSLTPYLVYARIKSDTLSDPGLTISSLPPPLAGPASQLNAQLNSLLRANPTQNTVSLGMRWDFMPNADLKLQFDHVRIGAGSTGTLSNVQPDFQTGGKVNVFSATVDFVF